MIARKQNRISRVIRRAVTLIEVIFSVGVVLVGLLGLLSILPLAGRRADTSISLNTSAAMAESVLDNLLTRQFLANDRLRGFGFTAAAPNLDHTTLTSTSSFVIDPMFTSGYEKIEGSVPAVLPVINNGYSQVFFPPYQSAHHPYLDPRQAASRNWNTTPFPPRMFRVGIASLSRVFDNNGNRLTTPAFVNNEIALALAESPDDLPVDRPTDRTLASRFRTSESGLDYGKRLPEGKYSWFATVNPLPDGINASVSVVIVKDRERSFITPTDSQFASTPEDNSASERIAHVSQSSGFRGGAGGSVVLRSSNATVSRLRSNDWLMLSRTVITQASPLTFEHVHRWFRVVSVDGKAEEVIVADDPSTAAANDAMNDQQNNAEPLVVWQHRVLLDGPDWVFGNNVREQTFATLVSGVVSVTERTVPLSTL